MFDNDTEKDKSKIILPVLCAITYSLHWTAKMSLKRIILVKIFLSERLKKRI
jgi:hypothetical protein